MDIKDQVKTLRMFINEGKPTKTQEYILNKYSNLLFDRYGINLTFDKNIGKYVLNIFLNERVREGYLRALGRVFLIMSLYNEVKDFLKSNVANNTIKKNCLNEDTLFRLNKLYKRVLNFAPNLKEVV